MANEVQLVKANAIVAKQPSAMGPDYDEYSTKQQLFRLLGLCEEDVQLLRLLCEMGRSDRYAWLRECKSTLSHCRTVCDSVKSECMSMTELIRLGLCPAQRNFGQLTIDEFSDDNQVNLTSIVQNFGAGFVNAYPVAPGDAIRLEHPLRPGYFPTKIAVDMSLANNGDNYLDIEIQFYLGPGGVTRGKPIGPAYRGNQFLNKDGTQIHLPFPLYRSRHVDVGSSERLAVEVRHTGGVNNITTTFITIYHDAECFYELCGLKSKCS